MALALILFGCGVILILIYAALAQIYGELRKIREAAERKASAKEELLKRLKSNQQCKECACKKGQYGEPSE